MGDEQLAKNIPRGVVVDVECLPNAACGAVATDQKPGLNLLTFSGGEVGDLHGDRVGVLFEALRSPAEADLDVGVCLRFRQQDRLKIHLRDALHGFERQGAVVGFADLLLRLVVGLVDEVAAIENFVEGPDGGSGKRNILIGARRIACVTNPGGQSELAEDFHRTGVHDIELGVGCGLDPVVDKNRSYAQPAEA